MSSKPFHICIFFIIFFTLAKRTLPLDNKFQACMPRTCGNGLNISYPFWIPHELKSFCGLPSLEVICRERNSFFSIPNVEYIIKDIFYANYSLLVAYAAAYKDTCPTPLHNISIHRTHELDLSSNNIDFSIFYNCTSLPDYPINEIECASNSSHLYSFAVFHKEALEPNYSSRSCQSLVDVQSGVNFTSLLEMNQTEIMKMGFLLNWSGHNCSSCQISGGRCGFENDEFVCFCQGGPHLKTCNDVIARRKPNWRMKIGIAVLPIVPAGNIFECTPRVWNNGYFVGGFLPPGINLSELDKSCDAAMKVPIFKTTAFNKVPVGEAAPLLEEALNEGFEVEYPQLLLVACSGRCGSNSTSEFVCYCRDGMQFLCCGPNNSNGRKDS